MSISSLFPLIVAVAYIPLILTTASSRPLQKRHKLFLLFLAPAMIWSLIDYFFRSQLFPDYSKLQFDLIAVAFLTTAVQFHVFISSFYPRGKGRWLPFAYTLLAVSIAMVFLGYVTGDLRTEDGAVYGSYKLGAIILFVPFLVLIARNAYVFWQDIKSTADPRRYNQVLSLLLCMVSMLIFIITAFLPWGKEFPISHFGNLINAFILSYAVIRHRLVDVRLVLRRGSAWLALGVVGGLIYWLLLSTLHAIFNFQLDMTATLVAIIIGMLIAVFIYNSRDSFFRFMSRAFQWQSYNSRQKLLEFTDGIHNVFSLKEQGGELLSLIVRAINIKEACLLFPEAGSGDFRTQFAEPKDKDNQLAHLVLQAGNPIIRYLERERKSLPRESLTILPSFLGLWPQEKEDIASRSVEVFIPLISRDRVIAILVVGEKRSGRYTLEDMSILEDVTGRVAVSIEKEYLREQLREREEELSVINNSSTILTSSMDIQEIYGGFIEELKKVVDIAWASIILVDDTELRCVAVSSTEGVAYQVGEELPMEGTGTGWVINHKKLFIDDDLAKERHFSTGENFYQLGFRTVVYLPLIAKGEVIGCFIVASGEPNAFGHRHIKLLEQLAAQIAMPLEHTYLYAKAELKARIDELTGLLNRRSLDEMLDSEISRHSRYGSVFSLAILDLDSFKTFNDTCGHLSGDRLLRQVGQVIKGTVRASDHAFRYGGDEFAILLPQTDADAAFQVVERVRSKIADSLDCGDIPVSASIGLAGWPDDGITHSDIIAAADANLYRAKRDGGNQSYRTSSVPVSSRPIEAGRDARIVIDERTLSVISALAGTVDARCQYPENHTRKVADYALALAKALGLDSLETGRLEACALLHDVGKLSISEAILNKSGELTAAEWATMQTHTELGAAIASRTPQLAQCANAVRHHHEWYNGKGYPDGLKDEAIPLEARILAVADAYAVMTSARPYDTTMTPAQALDEMKRGAGVQFDPSLVEQFVALYKTGVKPRKRVRR